MVALLLVVVVVVPAVAVLTGLVMVLRVVVGLLVLLAEPEALLLRLLGAFLADLLALLLAGAERLVLVHFE